MAAFDRTALLQAHHENEETARDLSEGERIAMYEGGSEIKVFVGSFNAGREAIKELHEWIPFGGTGGFTREGSGYDIIAIGLQEFDVGAHRGESELGTVDGVEEESSDPPSESTTPTPRESQGEVKTVHEDERLIMGRSFNKESEERVEQMFADHLGPDFVLISSSKRGFMQLRIYVRAELAPEVTDLEVGAENTGIGGIIANKGGQACALTLRGTSLVFVSCHLAANEGKKELQHRNADCQEIIGGVHLGPFPQQLDLTHAAHHVFWMGDLNYRVDLAHPAAHPKRGTPAFQALVEEVKARAAAADYAPLHAADELLRELAAGRVLAGFRTLPPRFPPTFKVEPGQELAYKDKRVPSYCDRVLWKSLPGLEGRVRPYLYQACTGVLSSDHKPIRATFSVAPTPAVVPRAPGEPLNEVVFSHLKAKKIAALDKDIMGGHSDPYIVFLADPPGLILTATAGDPAAALARPAGAWAGRAGDFPRTSVRNWTLNPEWKKDEVRLLLASGDAESLARCTLFACLMDRDPASADELIGVVALPGAALAAGELNEFALPVVTNGVPHGELSGEVRFNTLLPEAAAEELGKMGLAEYA
mmetsp:Transcript_32395/g.47404  ORF Transcript_32395/g.47404 Transcript_32395/m.47404 type:complete len:591 (+) Transcript_32395:66-1838(+)